MINYKSKYTDEIARLKIEKRTARLERKQKLEEKAERAILAEFNRVIQKKDDKPFIQTE
jgi:hypothetical protein